MKLICPVCNKNWDKVGNEWHRNNCNKIDYQCSGCGSKRKPINSSIDIEYTQLQEDTTTLHAGKLRVFGQPEHWPTIYGPKKMPEINYDDLGDLEDILGKKTDKKSFRKHIVLPDMQVTPDSPKDHLEWISKYISEKRPDVIINLGDFADMESLSSYDKGKTSFEGRRYIKDVKAAKEGMEILTKSFKDIKDYNPEMHLTIGNHEYRISRVVEDDPRLEGTLSIDNLEYESFGWRVHPFLEIAEIDGVHYSHYFCNQLSGKPIGGESVLLRLKNIGFSFVMGHQQIYLTGIRSLNNGKRIRGIVQGSCYLHDEEYRGPQSNNEWRGIFILHEVQDGDYSLMEISLDYLCRRYEGVPVWEFMLNKYPEIFIKSTWMKHQREIIRRKL